MASGACFFLTIFASFFFCIESASLFFVLPWPPANSQLTHADRKLEKLFFFLSFFLILSLIGYQRNRPPIHPAANKRRSADWIARLGRGTRASRRFDSIGKKSKILFKNNSAPFSFRKPTIRFVFRIAAWTLKKIAFLFKKSWLFRFIRCFDGNSGTLASFSRRHINANDSTDFECVPTAPMAGARFLGVSVPVLGSHFKRKTQKNAKNTPPSPCSHNKKERIKCLSTRKRIELGTSDSSTHSSGFRKKLAPYSKIASQLDLGFLD